MTVAVVVYIPASATESEFDTWLRQILRAVDARQLEVVGITRSHGGIDQALASGEADCALFARADHVPDSRYLIAAEVERESGERHPRQRRPQIVNRMTPGVSTQQTHFPPRQQRPEVVGRPTRR